MNRLVYSALAIFCFAVVSCSQETTIPDCSQDQIVLNIFNSPMTKAAGDAGAEYERQLNRLDCFFYVKDRTDEPCVYYQKAEINNQGSATISFIVDDLKLKEIFPSGALCDVFVIANLPGNPTFEAKSAETTMSALGQYALDMTEEKYDVINKPFVMTGSSRVQKVGSSASANIKLVRVASKVTMTVKVPKKIELGEEGNTTTMLPMLGDELLKTSFRYGTNKSFLSNACPDDPNNYINTDKIPYTLSQTTDTHYVFTCDEPFYTYSRSWEKGSENAAYVTFEMPWVEDKNGNGEADTEDTYKTYYYQILVNGKNREFAPNTWYDMIVTVGVLGSEVEELPKEIDELSYYVLDWTSETTNGEVGSGDRNEEVVIEKFNYLEVPQKHIEMDNVSTVAIRYNASHKIGVKFDTKGGKTVEGLPGTTNLTALYINNGSGTPAAAQLTGITLKDPQKPDIEENNVVSNFTDNGRGSLTFNYELDAEKVYSPAYVFITIWLDIDGDGVQDAEDILEEDVKITIYPAIFIMGDNSATRSIFVNGNYGQGTNAAYLTINGQRVGRAVGQDNSTYMHVISISAFNEKNNKFAYNSTQTKDTEYIIGDPRVRSSNLLGVGNDTDEVKQAATGWIKATDVKGTVRNLQYYYPTDTNYQVIAPKFRISSMLGGYSSSSPKGAALRCASYQEHGFPAGRWRLPTTAEILYIVELQRLGKIQQLFYNGNTYFSATDQVTVPNNNIYSLTTGLGNDNNYQSVRCVYDDWYWGSEREAIQNDSYNNYGGYQFTWGDRKVY